MKNQQNLLDYILNFKTNKEQSSTDVFYGDDLICYITKYYNQYAVWKPTKNGGSVKLIEGRTITECKNLIKTHLVQIRKTY
jgi:hypothetical protein